MKYSICLLLLSLSIFVNGQTTFDTLITIYDPMTLAPSSVLVDVDNDNQLDIVTSLRWNHKMVWHKNLGSGEFADSILLDVQISQPIDIVPADLDADGFTDLIVESIGSKINILINNQDGTYTIQDIVGNILISDIELLDINDDNSLDIVYGSYGDENIKYLLNDGDGNFGQKITITTEVSKVTDIEFVDVDLDADLDLVVIGVEPDFIKVFFNDGFFGFNNHIDIPFSSIAPRSIVIDDINQDNYPDLLVAFQQGYSIHYFINNAMVEFTEEGIIESDLYNVDNLMLSDLDNDGDKDLVAGQSSGGAVIYYNLGINEYSERERIVTSNGLAWSLNAQDIDQDCDQDLLMNLGNTVYFLKNQLNLSPPDIDLDGFSCFVDCDDTNPNVNPDAEEIPNNGID